MYKLIYHFIFNINDHWAGIVFSVLIFSKIKLIHFRETNRLNYTMSAFLFFEV